MPNEERVYVHKGRKYPRVTSILKEGIAKPGLIKWSNRLVLGHVFENMPHYTEKLLNATEETVKDLIELVAKIPDGKRNAAAGLGTHIHKSAELYANKLPQPEFKEGVQLYAIQFQRFLADFNPEYLYTEGRVFSDKWGYAGTFDAIAMIDGRLYMLDTKTGKAVYPEVALQLVAYAHADYIITKQGEVPLPEGLSRAAVLHLQPDRYELRQVHIGEDVFEVFLSVLDIYNWKYNASKFVIGPIKTPPKQHEEGFTR